MIVNEEIFDVILQTTGHFLADLHIFQENRPPEHFVFNEEFWIGRLPHDVDSDRVFDACQPAGLNFRPARQYGMRYAFCRRMRPESSDYYEWGSDLALPITVFLSRLIRPTTIALDYSARLYFENGELKTIVPGHTQGLGAHAWVVAKDNYRDWLSVPECERLRDLAIVYNRDAPDRVRRARKHIDHAFHAFYLHQRLASLVTSFEALLKVSQFQATRQFAARTMKLAEMLGHQLTKEEAEAMYRDRSAFVHGSQASFEELSDELIDMYNRFESVLRLALLRASTEADFAQIFSSDDMVLQTFGH